MSTAYDRQRTQEPFDRAVARLAAAQYGAFSRAQVRALGVTASMVDRRRALGRWDTLFYGVYRMAGAPSSWEQTLMAACLGWGNGAVVSHRACAALFHLPNFDPPRPTELIASPGRRRRHPDVTAHLIGPLTRREVTTVAGIPATTPARTLIDLAGVVDEDLLEEALDDALRRRLVTLAALRRSIDGVTTRGRTGIGVIRGLVFARRPSDAIPDSPLETRTVRLFHKHGVTGGRLHYRIRDGGRVIAIVDIAFPDARVAIEVESFRFHSGKRKWQMDLSRRNQLTALGWLVLHITRDDLLYHPDETIRALRRTLAVRSF